MQIILSDFMSLDGVVQAPGGPEEDTDGGFAHGGWSRPYFDVEAMGAAIDEVMQSTDALLFGRRTWQVMAAAWPGRAGDPFADRMNEIPKYVASRTLSEDDLTWRTPRCYRPTTPSARCASCASRTAAGHPGHGQRILAGQLIEHDLVDEYRLMIEPILLGGGKRLFPDDAQARPLELVSVTPRRNRRADLHLPARGRLTRRGGAAA